MFISSSKAATGSFGHVLQNGKGLLPQFTTGSSIFIGENAGASDDGSNNRNIGIGKNALDAATTGQLNIAIGDDALTDVTTGNYNVAIGFESQKDTTGGQNVSIGYNSLEFNTSGNNNTAIGYAAAGGFTYSGVSNIAIGYTALGGASVSGDYNIAIGHAVMGSITTADDNLAIGDFALTSIQTSTRNIAIGSEALRYIKDVGGTHGFNNTALGWNAGKRYGDNAGNLVSASFSVYIGHTTYPLEDNSQNEILIGSQVRGKGSNTATIGDGNITDIYLSQDQGATVHTGNVSGSATSTGSFGSAHIAHKVGIGTTGPGTVLPSGWSGNRLLEIRASSSGGDAGLFLRRFEGDGTYGMDFWTDTNSADNYIDSRGGISASELFIRVATHTTPINAARFDYLGNVEFPSATTISGSASSTGSFGNLRVLNNSSAWSSADDFIIGNTSKAVTGMTLQSTTSGETNIAFADGIEGNAGRFAGYIRYDHNATKMIFSTEGSQRVFIDGSGNVGIGDSTPSHKLEINDANSNSTWESVKITNSNSVGAGLTLAGGVKNWSIISNGSGGGAGGGNLGFHNTTDGGYKFIIDSDAATELLTLDGNIISGSATSTGSFGDGRFIGKVAIFGSGSKTPDTPLHIRGDFDGSGGLPNTNPDKGLNISKFTGLQSDYGKSDKFGITFTAASNGTTDYALAGIYGQVTNVSSYVGGSIIFATRLETESALTAKMAISSSGDVGIGTTSPIRKLQVNASSYTEAGGADANIHLSVANSTWSGIGLFGGSSQGGFIDFGDTDATHRGRILYSHASDYMAFNTSATEKVRITSGGNVGIGETTPTELLHLKKTGNDFATIIVESTANDTGAGSSIQITSNDGAVFLQNNSTARTVTRYGIAVGGFFEILAQNSTNGMMIGNGTTNKPIIFGLNNKEQLIISNNSISGSSTSTGSFGELHIADKVGIGTTNPAHSLHVVDSNNTADGSIRLASHASFYTTIRQRASSTGKFEIDHNGGSSTAKGMVFNINGTTSMGILHDRDVYVNTKLGIGNSDPSEVLDVTGNIQASGNISGSATSTGSFGSVLAAGTGRNNFIGRVGIGTTDIGQELLVRGANNSAGDTFTAVGAGNVPNITIQNAGTSDDTNSALFFKDNDSHVAGVICRYLDHSPNSAELRFAVTNNGTSRERVVISSSGSLGVGMPTFPATHGIGSIYFSGTQLSGSSSSTGSFGNVHVGKGGSSAQFANSKFSVVDNNSTEYAPMGGSSNTANAMVQFTNQNTSATAPHSLIHFRLDKSGGDGYMGFMTSTSTGNIEHFVVGNQVDGEIIRGASGGNVGIGDSNPSGKLVVSGSGTINLHIDNSGTGDTGLLGKRNATSIFGMFDDASDSKLRIVNYQAEPIEFSVDRGGSETIVMTMLNSGNVGIGTTSPDTNLHIASSTSDEPVVTIENTNSDATGGTLKFEKSTTDEANDDVIGTINFTGRNSANNANQIANIITKVVDTTNGSVDGSMLFQVIGNGSFTNNLYLESGKVGIGTTSPSVALEVRDATANNGHIGGKINVAGDWNESNIAYGGNRSPGVTIQSLDSTAGTFGTLSFMNANGYTGATIIAKHVLHGAGTGNMDTQLHFGTRGIDNVNSGAHNVSAMMIDEDGNVGIGDSNPAQNLVVSGSSKGLLSVGLVGGGSRVTIGDTTTDSALYMRRSSNGAANVQVLQLGSSLYVGATSNVINTVIQSNTSVLTVGSSKVTSNVAVEPTADASYNLGAADKRWANIFSADLQLSNEGTEGNEVDGTTGSWTIQEGEDDLYLLNRKNGKKYKFKLEEIT